MCLFLLLLFCLFVFVFDRFVCVLDLLLLLLVCCFVLFCLFVVLLCCFCLLLLFFACFCCCSVLILLSSFLLYFVFTIYCFCSFLFLGVLFICCAFLVCTSLGGAEHGRGAPARPLSFAAAVLVWGEGGVFDFVAVVVFGFLFFSILPGSPYSSSYFSSSSSYSSFFLHEALRSLPGGGCERGEGEREGEGEGEGSTERRETCTYTQTCKHADIRTYEHIGTRTHR